VPDVHPNDPPEKSNVTRNGYRANLEVFRTASLKAGIPFWNFFGVMPVFGHHDPSEPELRWQAFTSIVYGAKGLLYYCYWNPSYQGKVGGPTEGSIMSATGPTGESTCLVICVVREEDVYF
jgi:hypothetical protein